NADLLFLLKTYPQTGFCRRLNAPPDAWQGGTSIKAAIVIQRGLCHKDVDLLTDILQPVTQGVWTNFVTGTNSLPRISRERFYSLAHSYVKRQEVGQSDEPLGGFIYKFHFNFNEGSYVGTYGYQFVLNAL